MQSEEQFKPRSGTKLLCAIPLCALVEVNTHSESPTSTEREIELLAHGTLYVTDVEGRGAFLRVENIIYPLLGQDVYVLPRNRLLLPHLDTDKAYAIQFDSPTDIETALGALQRFCTIEEVSLMDATGLQEEPATKADEAHPAIKPMEERKVGEKEAESPESTEEDSSWSTYVVSGMLGRGVWLLLSKITGTISTGMSQASKYISSALAVGSEYLVNGAKW